MPSKKYDGQTNTSHSMSRSETFLSELKKSSPLLYKSVEEAKNNAPELFGLLSERMLLWYSNYSGKEDYQQLIKGYTFFTLEVNRSQALYERNRSYKHKHLHEVVDATYANDSFMLLYHWGVYVTTFAWSHHLEIYDFFAKHFINTLRTRVDKISNQLVFDFGCGSGIWSLLLASELPSLKLFSIDISKKSISLANQFIYANGYSSRIAVALEDANTFVHKELGSAAICCFLLEHLEKPSNVLDNICKNLQDGGFLYLTAALTAAEIDHIYELKSESQLILLLEQSGFRVIHMYSSAPSSHSRRNHYLPRSVAIIAQKRHNQIW